MPPICRWPNGDFCLNFYNCGQSADGSLYLWGAAFAFLAMVCNMWTRNIASQDLPVALAAQLIVSELAFAVIGGLVVHGRWPAGMEVAGVAVLIAGVVLAIRVFYSQRTRSKEASALIT